MINNILHRHKLIKSLMAKSREGNENTIFAIWEPLMTQVISIVGEDNFVSLHARSIFLTQKSCPWYIFPSQSLQAIETFMEFKMNFERLSPAQYNEANSLLLITFTDILASLIGEQLTLRILHSAWNRPISDMVGKELNNE